MTEKVRGRPFQKGASGNPAGRPRSGESIAEYIRQLAGADGRVYKLHAWATGEDTDARVLLAAIGVLLERGFGKAPQAIEHSETIDSPKIDTDSTISRRRRDAVSVAGSKLDGLAGASATVTA